MYQAFQLIGRCSYVSSRLTSLTVPSESVSWSSNFTVTKPPVVLLALRERNCTALLSTRVIYSGRRGWQIICSKKLIDLWCIISLNIQNIFYVSSPEYSNIKRWKIWQSSPVSGKNRYTSTLHSRKYLRNACSCSFRNILSFRIRKT
jgi:hypothetical protein